MKSEFLEPGLRRTVSVLLVGVQVLVTASLSDLTAAAMRLQAAGGPTVRVNRTAPDVEPVPLFPNLPTLPADADISRARVFEEPLIPIGRPSTEQENRALGQSIMAYLKRGNSEDVSGFEAFLSDYPDSPWRISLRTNIGIVYRQKGYFSRALVAFEEAWKAGRDAQGSQGAAIVDRAVAEYAELNARLGRQDVLVALFDHIQGRDVGGSAGERIGFAKQGLWLMQNQPGDAFRCGPMAVDRILAYNNPRDYKTDDRILKARSTKLGMPLVEIRALAETAGWPAQMAKRQKGAAVLAPAVVHWKSDHYAALVREQEGRYLIQDPTFGQEFWVSRAALEDEASGYFLVSGGAALPSGWEPVSEAEGMTVFGKGNTGSQDPEASGGNTPGTAGGCTGRGMCGYSIQLMTVGLRLSDIPVFYSPPRGPTLNFQVSYNQKDTFQPSLFTYSNLGPKWTFDWISYLKDDPSNLSAPVYLYLSGAGQETYTNYDSGTQSYARHAKSDTRIFRTATSPIGYERRLPDGSVEVFAQADGASTFPRRIFMTERRDPQGNAVTFTYDSSLRLVAATDAIGQVTTLDYDLSSDPLKITKVTDPFGRYATFNYTSNGRLWRITDIIGITSEISYGLSDFVNAVKTPYGATTFVKGESGTTRWIEATDAYGATERVEFRHGGTGVGASDPSGSVPAGMTTDNTALNYRNTFHWDKRAHALYPGDYTKAVRYHWLHTTDTNVTADVLGSFKMPLENRVWYAYPGQPNPTIVGNSNQPSAIGRVLDDGTTQLTKYEYNAAGMMIKETDPLGRETVYVYGTNNTPDSNPATGTGLDLLEVKQKNGSAYDVLVSTTYNAAHQPLTVTDAARQVTTYTYRSTGDLETIVTPPRGSLSEAQRTTTLSYYSDSASLGPGRIQQVAGPVSGATTTFVYDGYGRPRTVTESDSYAVTVDYDLFDRPTKVTYPDGTFEEFLYKLLDPQSTRDRKGRWTHYVYDALRRLVLTRDPLGQIVRQEWCTCGSLAKLIDAKGNATAWDFDAQNRVIKETRADLSDTEYVFEDTTSRLKRRTDAKEQHTDYAYFKDDNLEEVSYPNAENATPTVSYTYDAAYNRLATMVDGTGTTSYSYHAVTTGGTLGATQLATVDGPLSNDVISYTYDELGRSLSRSINSVSASQTYDVLGRVDSVTNALGSFTYSYVNQTSRLAGVSYPNGQTTSYSYLANAGDRRLSEIHNQLSGGATLSKFNYAYDPVGNITTWTQQRDSGGSAVTRAYDFGYDATDQLASATYRTTDATPTILKRYVYTYDPAGNRTTEQIDDDARQASYNNMNRLTSQGAGGALYFSGTLNEPATVTIQSKPATVLADNTFSGKATVPSGTSSVTVASKDYSGNLRTNTYEVTQTATAKTFTHDANGNMTGDGTRTFEWDAENRLVALDVGTHRSEFTYDALHRRVRSVRADNGVPVSDTRFVWCSFEMCEEREILGSAATRRMYHQGIHDDTTPYYYTRDHIGSLREMTDGSNAIRSRNEYDPYGRLTKLSGDKDTPIGFTGHYVLPDTDLLAAPFRSYDASIGRWVNEDPLRLRSGDINFYNYVLGNPTSDLDPLGLQRGRSGGTYSPPHHSEYIPGTGALPSNGAEAGVGLLSILANLFAWSGAQANIRDAQARNLAVWKDGQVYQPWETRMWWPPDPRDRPRGPMDSCTDSPSRSPCNTWPNGCWYPPFPAGVIPPPRPSEKGMTRPDWMAPKGPLPTRRSPLEPSTSRPRARE